MSAEDVEWTLGVLLAAGHDPNHLLDSYSFAQLALFARCTLGHHVRMLDLLLRPLHGAQGLGWKDHDVPRPHTPRTVAQEEAREAALLHRIAVSPFGVRTARTSNQQGTPADG